MGTKAEMDFSLKDLAPEERAEVLTLALQQGWTKDRILDFLNKVAVVHQGYGGKYSVSEIITRANQLSATAVKQASQAEL